MRHILFIRATQETQFVITLTQFSSQFIEFGDTLKLGMHQRNDFVQRPQYRCSERRESAAVALPQHCEPTLVPVCIDAERTVGETGSRRQVV